MLEYFLIGGGLMALLAYSKGLLSFGDIDCDISVDRQFGMNLTKNQLIMCPDDYVRFSGASHNKIGSWDITTTDDRIIRGVDERRNIKYGTSPITTMAGRGTVLCNVEVNTGREIGWKEWLGFDVKAEYLVDLLEMEQRRNTNIRSFGYNPYDGGSYTRMLDEDTKKTGLRLKNLGMGRGAYGDAPTEVQMRQRPMDAEDESGAY